MSRRERIVWALTGGPAGLRVLRGNSDQASERGRLERYKSGFNNTPLVANGRAYVTIRFGLVVYSLLSP
ncbi:MAG: hypothetical protein HYR60_28665 [Acidobacteria bacterium]|nr:hypothetical protein [Acidobacteriota bacterium]